MPTYSVAICNLDMAQTLERSLRCLLEQVDERFEVVVVDGGSEDGSVEILESLDDEFDALTPVFRDRDPDRTLGEDRNTACQHASGDYIIDTVDVDDLYYEHALTDFVRLFEQVETHIEEPFRFHGIGAAITDRDLLVEEYPYRALDRCEDRDLWRRLFADDRIIWLSHEGLGRSIGYNRDLPQQIETDIEEKTCDFQAGVTLLSCLRYTLLPDHFYILERERSRPATVGKRAYDIVTYLWAYARSLRRNRYDAPAGFERYAQLERTIAEESYTLDELAAEYDLDTSCLSEEGQRRLGTPRR